MSAEYSTLNCPFCGITYTPQNHPGCNCPNELKENTETDTPIFQPAPKVSDIGVIVGRFQSPYVHAGYKELIDFALSRHARVFVFIGQSPLKCNQRDPFDFKIRFDMLHTEYPNVEICRIDDVGDVERWSRNLDYQIALLAGPSQTVTLYGSRDCFPYSGRYERKVIIPTHNISSTKIRRETGLVSINSEDFRKGVVWATQNRWPICYPTVDIAVFDFKNDILLLGKKPGEVLWRFPGGFADVNSNSYEEDALRELKEETSLIGKSLEYIGSRKIEDWRYHNLPDKIKTLFYVVTVWEGELKASDDLAYVEWLPLNTLNGDMFVPNHRSLFAMLLSWRNRLLRLTQKQ